MKPDIPRVHNVVCFAFNPASHDFRCYSVYVSAASEDAATAGCKDKLMVDYPPADGWRFHGVSAKEIPDDIILAAARPLIERQKKVTVIPVAEGKPFEAPQARPSAAPAPLVMAIPTPTESVEISEGPPVTAAPTGPDPMFGQRRPAPPRLSPDSRSTPKRIAVCFSGQLRGFRHCFQSLRMLLCQYYDAGIPMDVYACLTIPGPEEGRLEDFFPGAVCQYVEDKPIHGSHVDTDFLSDASVRPYNKLTPAEIFGAMTRKTMQVFSMLRGDYDLVIRTRPDNFYEQPFDLSGIDPAQVNIPHRFGWGGYSDRFAAGGMDAMRIACGFYNHLNDYKGNCECRFQQYLDSRIVVNLLDIPHHHIHTDGTARYNRPQDWGYSTCLSVVRPRKTFCMPRGYARMPHLYNHLVA